MTTPKQQQNTTGSFVCLSLPDVPAGDFAGSAGPVLHLSAGERRLLAAERFPERILPVCLIREESTFCTREETVWLLEGMGFSAACFVQEEEEARMALLLVPESLRYALKKAGETERLLREALGRQDAEGFLAAYGAPYPITGEVVHGQALGRRFGMPTANLSLPKNKCLPPYGVYATHTWVDGVRYRGISNIGPRPTVDSEPRPLVENHIFDFEGDLYGKTVTVETVGFVRGIRRFPGGLAEIRKQLDTDAQAARRMLKRWEEEA